MLSNIRSAPDATDLKPSARTLDIQKLAVYRWYMKDTTVKVSTATRERIRAFGGATHEDTIIEALDALESERFWQEAEAGKKWLDGLAEAERQRLVEEDEAIDALFKGI